MTRKLLTTLTLFVAGCTQLTDNPTTQPPDGYRLVWSDEFNTDGPLNPDDWNFERGFVRNHELQWYQPDNATCKDGLLVIEARRERKPNPEHDPASRDWRRSREFIDYTSASVTTAKKREFRFGRLEVRARIDARPGSWPAIWALGATGHWPACGEVDIMEYYDDSILANVAWAGSGRTTHWNEGKLPIADFGPGWSKQFHVWRMDWDETSIRIYCDDRLLNSQDLTRTLNDPRRAADDGAPANPFHQPMYLLLNQAIGGQRGGDPSKTDFPIRYEIDYVRIYQKTPESPGGSTKPAATGGPSTRSR